MTRKSVKFPPGLRRGPWKTNLTKRESDNKNISSSVFISASNLERWSNLKVKFRFGSDSELVDYLLTLGENQPKPSLSPDHESDDGWCPPNQNGRKKRGPSLRAVLRRSNRKTGTKSDCVSDSIEGEEFQSEDSEQSESDTSHTRKFNENCSRNIKQNDCSNALPKKRLDSQSGSNKFSNSDEEKEAKAHQLDAELALIVESVDLQPHKENESELYEFKDDTQDERHFSSGSPTVSSNNTSKVAHRRWKSYHKDKRKWKQSYAAVVPDEEEVMKPIQKDEESTSSEKDRRIFKALKKNRILTAYLDSQNKIADSISKDSCHSRGEDDKVSTKEQEDKSEQELSQPGNKKVLEADIVDSDDTKSKEDICEMPIFEKSDVSSGKENQSKAATLSEPIIIEVGERVKLKKRKKKLLYDSEEPTTNLKEDNKNSNESNINDVEKHSKQKRNWKKSLINYEVEEQDSELKKKKTDINSPSIVSNFSKIAVKESQPEVSPNVSEIKSVHEEKIKKETHNESPKLVIQDNELSDQDNDSALVSQCSQCCLRHVQQPCPVLNPLNVLEDSISFEQWQLQCQVQVRCSVIESPRSKSGRLRKSAPGSPITNDAEKKNKDVENSKAAENTHVYAEESLPYALGLQVINEEHGKSVVCRSSIAQFTQFGPLVGPRVHEKDISEESDMKHIWEVLNEKNVKYLSTEDPQKSNWLRFIRPAPERHERNITISVKNEQLYFISIVEIPEGNELLYWADDHISSWSKKKNLKSSCGGCNMRFAHPLYYRTHCAVFHDPFHSLTIRKYHCKVCGEAVMGKENIMKHAADLHDGRGAYQCQYCHKFFLRLNYLEMHRTYGCSSNPHRTRPLCDFCGRYFCQPQKLKVHIKRMHSDMSEVLKEFQCKSCLKILGSRAALQRHFKEVHHRDVVVASSCDRCGKSFQNRSNLKIHMLTHSGVKPFRCQQEGCSAAFTTKQCLQFHYKKAHGLSEDALPRIERSIAYTFDAYAGETADGNIAANKDQMKKPPKLLRKTRKSSAKKNRSQEVQPEEAENQHEETEPVVPIEPIMTEVTECSEPDLVNHIVESNPYTTVVDSIHLPDSSLSHTERRPLTPGELIISMSYEEEERQLLGSKVLTPLRTVTHLQHHSAGHKKWLGEVIEVAEEAAAAAMRLSPRLSPHLKRDIYDFDENKVKSKLQYLEIPVRQELQVDVGLGRSKTSTALAPFHHPESASMLVEAALDAAERDICCPSLSSKMSSSPVPMSQSPEPLHLSHPSYCVRSPHQEGPPTLPSNVAFYNADPGDYSVSPSPHLHPLDSYSIPSSHLNTPPRLYSTQSHQVHQHHALPSGPLSSDDEGATDPDCNSRGECAQNLSLSGKDKLYNVPPEHPGMASRSSDFQDHMLLSQQNDLNFSGTVVVSPPHYHLYDLSPDRQRSDVSVTDLSVMSGHRGVPQDYGSYEDVGGSMDLSVPRVHSHGHVSPPGYNTGHVHQYTASDCVPDCVPAYSSHSHPHPPAYQDAPLQRPHISSSSTSPSASPSPGPAHYHSYPQYY